MNFSGSHERKQTNFTEKRSDIFVSNISSQTFNIRMVNWFHHFMKGPGQRLDKLYVDHVVNANEEIRILLYFA